MSAPTGSGWEFTASKMILDKASRYEASRLAFLSIFSHFLEMEEGVTIVLRVPATWVSRSITASESYLCRRKNVPAENRAWEM